MFLLFTVLFFVFVASTFNSIQFSDILYVCIAVLPGLMYYRRKSQINLVLMFINIFTVLQLAVYYQMTYKYNISGIKPTDLFVVGDSTMLAVEYVEYLERTLHLFSLICVVSAFAFMEIIYFYRENASLIKQCKDTKTYYNCLRILRDRLYSLKAMCSGYVVLTLCISFYQLCKLQDKMWLSGVLLVLGIAIMYGVIGNIVNREWNKTVLECGEKEKSERDVSVEDMDIEEVQ